MKKSRGPLLHVAFAGVGLLMLAQGGTTGSADVCFDSSSAITICEEGPFDTAAGELSRLLERYLKLALHRDDLKGTGAPVEIAIGAQAAHWHDLPRGALADVRDVDAFEIEVTSKPRAMIRITGQTPVAAGYGVMALLEEQLGLHWAFPGELGRCFPARNTFRLPEGWSVARPFVVARTMSGFAMREPARDHKQQATSGVVREERAFFSVEDFFKSLRLHHQTVTHNMIHIFPIEESLAKHPEIFPKREDGQRFVPATRAKGEGTGGKNSFQAWHPCYTQPKTLEVAIAKGRQAFAEGRLFFSLGINDGKRVQCQCAECRRVGWPQSYYQFVTQVAEALHTHYPPQMVGVLAYGDVGRPPRGLKLPDNVLVNIAGNRHDVCDGIAPAVGAYDYIYGAGFVIPNLPLEVIAENFRHYRRQGLLMYRAEAYPLWAFDAPKIHIIRRLLWNPDQDVCHLLREYCDRTFGEAGEAMYRYYLVAAAWRHGDVRPGTFTPLRGDEWPFHLTTLQFQRCPTDLHAKLSAALDEAAACQLTDDQRRRIEMVAAFTEFSSVLTDIWRYKEAVFCGMADSLRTVEGGVRLAARKDAAMARLREHPQWFYGSSIQFHSLAEREWPVVPLEQQLQAALATARNPAAGAIAAPGRGSRRLLVPLARKEHPSYKPEQTVAMDFDRGVAEGFGFKSVANAVIQDDEDPRHRGRQKAQWLRAVGRNLPNDGRPLVLEMAVNGAAGMLELRVEDRGKSEERAKTVFAHCLIPLPAAGQSATRRIVIVPPLLALAPSERKDAAEENAAGNLELRLLWRPDQPTAHLEGSVTLKPLSR